MNYAIKQDGKNLWWSHNKSETRQGESHHIDGIGIVWADSEPCWTDQISKAGNIKSLFDAERFCNAIMFSKGIKCMVVQTSDSIERTRTDLSRNRILKSITELDGAELNRLSSIIEYLLFAKKNERSLKGIPKEDYQMTVSVQMRIQLREFMRGNQAPFTGSQSEQREHLCRILRTMLNELESNS